MHNVKQSKQMAIKMFCFMEITTTLVKQLGNKFELYGDKS
jgi:hypothetical protein